MDKNIYKEIGKYLLKKTDINPNYIVLLKNKEEIMNMFNEKDINNINVNVDNENIKLEVINTKIPIKEIIIDSMEKELSKNLQSSQDFENIIINNIENALQDIIETIGSDIWNNIYENTEEINDGMIILNYQKKYISRDYKKITQSSKNFLEYIEEKYKTYDILENILHSEQDNQKLGDIIRQYIYEDIGIHHDKIIYNFLSDHLLSKDIYKKIFYLVDKHISNTQIIHKIIGDILQIQFVKDRSKNTLNYIKYNYVSIIEGINNPTIKYKTIKKYKFNKNIQNFVSDNVDIIHSIIQEIGNETIEKNIKIFEKLLETIIDDKFVINLEQIKRSKS